MYEHYRKNRKKVAKGINQYKLWIKALAGLIIVAKELMTENENGLYIEGFGYFYFRKKNESRRRVSLLKKKIVDIFEIRFIFEKENLNERYRFRAGKTVYYPKRNKEYQSKYEAIKLKLQLEKQYRK